MLERLIKALVLSIVLTNCASNAAAHKDDKVVRVPSKLGDLVQLKRVYRKLQKPVGLEFFAGDPQQRLFVVQQGGVIEALPTAAKSAKYTFLDLRTKVSRKHNEQGLLGLAFHPNFKTNRRLFVNYTDKTGATIVAEFQASAKEPLTVNGDKGKTILRVEQPWGNHNGGYLEFGPDGQLYVGMGDGGAGGDPKGAGQNAKTQLGKMLQIDVDKPSQPIRILQKGLRNPWRFSFDSKTGDFYVADVGQNRWEEINVVSPKNMAGANYGWANWEGRHCFTKGKCSPKGMVTPAIEFNHDVGCSITGGFVYRGKAFPALHGNYFYSDYCTAILRSFRWQDNRAVDHWDWKQALDSKFRLANISAFAADSEGELYILSHEGSIYKMVPRTTK